MTTKHISPLSRGGKCIETRITLVTVTPTSMGISGVFPTGGRTNTVEGYPHRCRHKHRHSSPSHLHAERYGPGLVSPTNR